MMTEEQYRAYVDEVMHGKKEEPKKECKRRRKKKKVIITISPPEFIEKT